MLKKTHARVCTTQRNKLGARNLIENEISTIFENMPAIMSRKLNAKNLQGRHWSRDVDVRCAKWVNGKCMRHAIRYCCKGDSRLQAEKSATILTTTTTAAATTTAATTPTTTTKVDPCEINNGDCQEICTSSADGSTAVCSCSQGKVRDFY